MPGVRARRGALALSEWSCLGVGAVAAASGAVCVGGRGSQKLGAKVGAAVEDGASGEDNGQKKLLLRPSHLETGSSDGGGRLQAALGRAESPKDGEPGA